MTQILGVSRFGAFNAFSRRSLGIQMLELAGFDFALTDKVVDLVLLETDNATKSVRGQLPFVNQSIERARCQTQRYRSLFRREPITICLSHRTQDSSISTPLGHFRCNSMHGCIRSGLDSQGDHTT